MQPRGLLLDYGGTLVEEVGYDPRAGHEWLFARASYRPSRVTLEDVLNRADRVAREVSERRDQFHLEATWPTLTRLIYDFFGIRFDDPMPELELGFWKASVQTRPMAGAGEALEQFSRSRVPMAVLSNSGFGEHVIRYELDKYGLANRLAFVMASAEYAVRKPNVLLFETAAARLGIDAKDIWFVGNRLDTDVAGAKAAGMTAVWFRLPSARDLPSDHADFIATGWNDLVRRFQESTRQRDDSGPPATPGDPLWSRRPT